MDELMMDPMNELMVDSRDKLMAMLLKAAAWVQRARGWLHWPARPSKRYQRRLYAMKHPFLHLCPLSPGLTHTHGAGANACEVPSPGPGCCLLPWLAPCWEQVSHWPLRTSQPQVRFQAGTAICQCWKRFPANSAETSLHSPRNERSGISGNLFSRKTPKNQKPPC